MSPRTITFPELSTHPDIQELPAFRGSCLTIYQTLSTSHAHIKEFGVQLGRVRDQAAQAMGKLHFKAEQRRRYTEAIDEILESARFWFDSQKTIGIFVSEEAVAACHLPWPSGETIIIDDRFHVVPLLPAFCERSKFYLLSLGTREARLFKGDRFHLRELLPEEMSTSLGQALRHFRTHAEPDLIDQPSQMPVDIAPPGVPASADEESMVQRCRELDYGLKDFFRDQPGRLILACQDHNLPLFIQAVDGDLDLGHLPECLETAALDELHRKAVQKVQAWVENEKARLARSIFDHIRSDGRGSYHLPEIARAAVDGRVDTCLLMPAFLPGIWDPGKREWLGVNPAKRPAPPDLLNFIATEAMAHGGCAEVLEKPVLPDNILAVANFR